MPSNHLILCYSLLLLPSIFPSIRVFSNESVLHIRWPKYWSFSFRMSPCNEYSGLISFRIDWLDLLAVQRTLKSLLQHLSSKEPMLWCSVFFMIQLLHPWLTTGKTIALTRWTFVSKVMSLLFNMLSRLVVAFLSRSKHLLISWLQSPSAVILKPTKIKSVTVYIFTPSIERDWKTWLKNQNSKNKDHGIQSHHFMANRWGNNEQWETLFLGAPKSLQLVTAAMKSKDACSLEEKPWPT